MPRRGEPSRPNHSATTGLDENATAVVGGRFLLVTAHGAMRVLPLPDQGEVLLGRGRNCQVSLDHPSISRQHARLRVGATCTVIDLGSRNGIVFRGARLAEGEHGELRPGESFSVGPFSLLVLPAGAPPSEGGAAGSRLRIAEPTGATPSPLLVAVARSLVNVVIYGETGVGKEVLAATLHRLSGRTGPLLGVNCATLGEALLESELFGHERGAFTGAVQSKPGLLQAAAGGTMLLDEVGDMAPAIQAKLLRAIDKREILRVGSVKAVPIDVRFVAATHRDLLALAEQGAFRKDLYYRLAGFLLEIPPLRERKDQIAELATTVLAEAAAREGAAPRALTAAASAALAGHSWPGNVRELRNVIERARLLAGGGDLRPEHVLFDTPAAGETSVAPVDGERARILAALEACAGNQTRAAAYLGMSRTTFVQRILEHGIPRPRKRR